VYTIHGGKDLAEEQLDHLAGHKNSKPVRIGNGAVDHLQLVSARQASVIDFVLMGIFMIKDIYGELMDAIYLAQKFSKPLVRNDSLSDIAFCLSLLTFVSQPELGRLGRCASSC